MARKKKKVEEEIVADVIEEIVDTPVREQVIEPLEEEVKLEPKKAKVITKVETPKAQPVKKSTSKKFKAQNLADFLY